MMDNTVLAEIRQRCCGLSRPASQDEIQELLALVGTAPHVFTSQARFSSSYVRTPIITADQIEILVLGWRPGQASPVHNHAGSWCGVRVLNGTATEIVYRQGACGAYYPSESKVLPTGSITTSFDQDVHQMANVHGDNLITVHCYSPPLTSMTALGEDSLIPFFSPAKNGTASSTVAARVVS